MKIRLIGRRNNLGIGTHYGYFSDALRQLWPGEIQELDLEDQSALQAAAAQSQANDVNISFVSMNLEGHFRGHNIQWIVFESTLIPELVASTLRAAQWVWVPSTWGRDILMANHIDPAKIDIVPEGVDPQRFQPCGIQPGKPFRFLTLGKAERRKSIGETLQAFCAAFGADPTVELVVKTNHFFHADHKRAELEAFAAHSTSRIRIEWGDWSTQQLRDLYHDCHVFVFPTRGEGWGLPLIEALATGMPAITTLYSAHCDFVTDCATSVIPVQYDMAPVDCEEYRLFYQLAGQPMGEWAAPRVDSIAQGMLHARANYDQLRTTALANSRDLRARWNWAASAARALTVLRQRGLLLG